MSIFEQIVKELNKKDSKLKINKNTEFKKLGLDSMDLIELIIILEKKYNIHIEDDKLLYIKTVNDLILLIEKENEINK